MYAFFIALVIWNSAFLAHADPCRDDFGGCDAANGLCWGTGRDTHFCSCKAGFKPDKDANTHTCEDVDECYEENLCGENALCRNTYGSYECTCVCGYVMDYTGQHCLDASKITDMCVVPSSCFHEFLWWLGNVPFDARNGKDLFITDVNSPPFRQFPEAAGKDRCSCEPGFELNNCGYCVDIDECAAGSTSCTGVGSRCVNTEGSYYCDCDEGYLLGPCRRRCYRPQQRMPLICKTPDLSSLSTAGSKDRMVWNLPIVLNNWRTCPDDVEAGKRTVERYDVDHDGVEDVILTWSCIAKTATENRSILKQYSEEEARWDQWTCWTACKATCWGGVQTRSRKCLHGIPGTDGCEGSGSQNRECYTGPKCPYRVRKDAKTLTRAEESDLLQAMEKYKNDMSVKGFHNAASAHGWPFQCNRQSCCPHGAKMKFLAWHRTIVLNYEEGLARHLKDKTIGLPYWNWLAVDKTPPNLAWSPMLNGQDNPFTNMTVHIDQDPMTTIQRGDSLFMRPLEFAHNTWNDVTVKIITPHSMHAFSESLESAHGGPHVSVCGGGTTADCTVSLARLRYAGFDPLFMLHHSQVDRLWAVAQKKLEDAGVDTWTPQTALEALEPQGDFGQRHMPFANNTLNSFPIVQAVNTMRDSYYYKELTGIKYDFLGNDGFPENEQQSFLVSQRSLRVGGQEALFIGQYLHDIDINIYVNYYAIFWDMPCNELGESERVGSMMIMAAGRAYNNSIPNLVVMEKVGFSNLDEDYNIRACYTSQPDCTSSCSEVESDRISSLADPVLIHHLPNQPVDMYKFQWSPGRKLPGFNINLEASSQWVYFFGDRVANIVQVRNENAWLSCDSSNGRAFTCSSELGSACILRMGLYYLIDNDEDHCKSGLRMKIASRQ